MLSAALKEATGVIREPNVLLVEVTVDEAILRSVTEFQPAGSLRMPIPYRIDCAYTLINGTCINLKGSQLA